MGPETGLNNLCIIATNSTEDILPAGTYRNAVTVPTYLVDAGPTPVPTIETSFNKEINRALILWPERKNEGLDRYEVKGGLAEKVSCEDPQGYRHVTSNWLRPQSNFPLNLCVYAVDPNNQRSELKEYILEWEALKNSAP